MLEIKKITKIYKTEGFTQTALDKISVNFRECEFTSILGPSGSGKTTFLNIIGGLDKYTSGDLIINEISTKKYKDSDWDSYRNHRIGFVFQNYNLISHQSILNNVKLALTLSGISKKEAIKKAKQALKDVGLEKHINKKPNQLSGGQMQRVAIARALVNDPDILLADEPTGALDSETSIQIMKLLKNISKNKLVIMVTHNPELANEYSNRIITLKDGKITSDSNPYDGKEDTSQNDNVSKTKTKKTSMSFKTALSLSFNNLMTKKGRTILVSIAGSIGIIGIALILSVSTGFQNYVDYISEDTLSSYPLTIYEESTDITSMLLSMQSGTSEKAKGDKVTEEQYITNMLSTIKANDLKSFKKYLTDNYKKVEKNISTVKYSYSIDPLIYTIDATGSLVKLNPNNIFTSIYGSSSFGSYSSMASTYTQMIDNKDTLKKQYDVLAGSWPTKYDEMIIVLPEPNKISDYLVYSLGLRDTKELTNMVTSIMSGTAVDINNEPMTLTYDDLLNINLKLIQNVDTYKYNSKYDVYEDMTSDMDYMNNLYENATELKIVGIVAPKEGMSSSALQPGVAYTSDLIKYINEYSSTSEAVQKQKKNKNFDIIAGKRFDEETNDYNFSFEDLVKVDSLKLQEAFNIQIDQEQLAKQNEKYIEEINGLLTTDTTQALTSFNDVLNKISDKSFQDLNKVSSEVFSNNLSTILSSDESNILLTNLENEYIIPKDVYNQTYNALITGLFMVYTNIYPTYDSNFDTSNPLYSYNEEAYNYAKTLYYQNPAIVETQNTMAKNMTEAYMKKNVLTKVGELTSSIATSISSAFNIDQNAITSAFNLNFSEDELSRVVASMMTNKSSTYESNLIALGYQDEERPTYISFYFNDFDSKETFLSFIDDYNKRMKSTENEDKVINYSDTTGILMGSVKTIVNAVSYVLIAFVSISLVVSSIMIGVITYISVYERTKEIGILRSIGASKKNISSIFNAEKFIIFFLSGLFCIGITYSLIPIINAILHHFTGNIPLNATLSFKNALILLILSIILTLIGGLIPAKSASKKDPVEALRSE